MDCFSDRLYTIEDFLRCVMPATRRPSIEHVQKKLQRSHYAIEHYGSEYEAVKGTWNYNPFQFQGKNYSHRWIIKKKAGYRLYQLLNLALLNKNFDDESCDGSLLIRKNLNWLTDFDPKNGHLDLRLITVGKSDPLVISNLIHHVNPLQVRLFLGDHLLYVILCKLQEKEGLNQGAILFQEYIPLIYNWILQSGISFYINSHYDPLPCCFCLRTATKLSFKKWIPRYPVFLKSGRCDNHKQKFYSNDSIYNPLKKILRFFSSVRGDSLPNINGNSVSNARPIFSDSRKILVSEGFNNELDVLASNVYERIKQSTGSLVKPVTYADIVPDGIIYDFFRLFEDFDPEKSAAYEVWGKLLSEDGKELSMVKFFKNAVEVYDLLKRAQAKDSKASRKTSMAVKFICCNNPFFLTRAFQILITKLHK